MYSITVVMYSEYAVKFSASSASNGGLRCSLIYLRKSSTESNVNISDSFVLSDGFKTNAFTCISMPSRVSLNNFVNLLTQPRMSDVDMPTVPIHKTSSVPIANNAIFLPLINGSDLITYPAIEKISRISGQSCLAGVCVFWGTGMVVAGIGVIAVVGADCAGAKVFAGAIFSRGGRGGIEIAGFSGTGTGVCVSGVGIIFIWDASVDCVGALFVADRFCGADICMLRRRGRISIYSTNNVINVAAINEK